MLSPFYEKGDFFIFFVIMLEVFFFIIEYSIMYIKGGVIYVI